VTSIQARLPPRIHCGKWAKDLPRISVGSSSPWMGVVAGNWGYNRPRYNVYIYIIFYNYVYIYTYIYIILYTLSLNNWARGREQHVLSSLWMFSIYMPVATQAQLQAQRQIILDLHWGSRICKEGKSNKEYPVIIMYYKTNNNRGNTVICIIIWFIIR
jgi:hypothetical protein